MTTPDAIQIIETLDSGQLRERICALSAEQDALRKLLRVVLARERRIHVSPPTTAAQPVTKPRKSGDSN